MDSELATHKKIRLVQPNKFQITNIEGTKFIGKLHAWTEIQYQLTK